MEWLTSIRTAIDYMENHLEDNISSQDVANQVYLSPFFHQRGFSLMTGFGIGEYIRNKQALVDNCIGEYGVCIDDIGGGKFWYLIAGKYTGGDVPEGMVIYEFPKSDWAVFNCIGPIPEALQSVNTRIFQEWLPGNPEFELCGDANVEWYDCVNGEKTDPEYHSAIWVPVKKKE